MSTKWNKQQKLQKTPAVCKKGPDDLPPSLRQWRYWTLTAYAYWESTVVSDFSYLSGQCLLWPFPDRDTHEGRILGNPFEIDVKLFLIQPSNVQRLQVSLLSNGQLEEQVETSFSLPEPVLPYIAGLYTWDLRLGTHKVRAKVFS